ncbi:FAD-binding protein [Govanella unica]|uniref:FAD-binding oxidoreductase n=1 Tax=Govanella unica TaxID=2975056 RepID=A0A9X3Z6U9_9PROT|nr:FAD-binding oxidoreductase [Govania unica]MDA5193575.1 FAD-binding oxidoreductase [Govania unica]
MSVPEQFKSSAAAIVGADNVLFGDDFPQPPTTSPRVRSLAGRVCPGSSSEVAAILKLATAEGVAVYPVSTGRNWGYGDAIPPRDGAILLDLGRMNRIRAVDEQLAYAVIEPGVTQGALYDHLRERGLKLWLDCTGAGPDGGIIGNVLERGFGHTPYGDRFLAVAGLEIALPTGEILKTGFGRYDNSTVTHLYPYGVGPVLDGLFSQSGMGVVTSLGLWLMPEPEYFCAAVVMVKDSAAIAPLIERLRPLRLDGTLKSIVHIGNDMRLIGGRQRYPYEALGGLTPLPEDVRADLRRQYGIAAWSLTAGFYGSRSQVKAGVKRLRQALQGLPAKVMVVDERLLALGRRASGMLPQAGMGERLRRMVGEGEEAIGLLRGKPTRHFLAGAYWRNRRASTGPSFGHDPAADGCGLLWLAPVIPMTGDHAARLVALAELILRDYGFECPLTFSMVTARALAAIMTICFDRDNEEEAAAAAACYEAATKAFIAAGYPPYRLASQFMSSAVQDPADPYWQTVSRLKAALDPAGILAPGRYQP